MYSFSKLPGGLSNRWYRNIQGLRRSFGTEICFLDFSGFENEETILVNKPIFQK